MANNFDDKMSYTSGPLSLNKKHFVHILWAKHSLISLLAARVLVMDSKITAFVKPVVEHWLEQEVAPSWYSFLAVNKMFIRVSLFAKQGASGLLLMLCKKNTFLYFYYSLLLLIFSQALI